ncbi:MAG: zf-TFIIB domain-containing protein [Planctomycetales bacterium]|nr:zf-TFIIB domain-containing protein [Planctomycetales bacterium]
MRCPVCDNWLRSEKHQEVEFYICSVCRGIGVSGEQFHALAVKVASEGQVPSSAKLTFEPRKVLRRGADNPVRNCPTCRKPMREFNYAYDSNVFLDRCQQCKGIWLDPNEIIDIAAHIQYNPDVDAVGRAMIKDKSAEENETAWMYMLAGAAVAILRVLIFKR